jgi:hypothetical protein
MLNNCQKNKGKYKYMLFKTGTLNGTLNAYSELYKIIFRLEKIYDPLSEMWLKCMKRENK